MDKTVAFVLAIIVGGIAYFVGHSNATNVCKEINNALKGQLEMKHESMKILKDKCGSKCWEL